MLSSVHISQMLFELGAPTFPHALRGHFRLPHRGSRGPGRGKPGLLCLDPCVSSSLVPSLVGGAFNEIWPGEGVTHVEFMVKATADARSSSGSEIVSEPVRNYEVDVDDFDGACVWGFSRSPCCRSREVYSSDCLSLMALNECLVHLWG